MRSCLRGSFIGMAAVLLLGVMLLPDGAQAQSPGNYKAPRTADGKPDLNGIWQALNEANWNIEPHSADYPPDPKWGSTFSTPPGVGVVVGGELPYLPGQREIQQANYADRIQLDPENKCYLPGVPRATYMPYPFQIIQGDQDIMFVYEYAGGVRVINMGVPTESPAPAWMGWSNGHWEGETLVVDVTSQNGDTWFDRAGNHHSDQIHVVERYTARGPDSLLYEATIEDPATFSQPFTIRMPLYRRAEDNARLLEFKCVIFAEELLYGHLRKGAEPEDSQ